MKLCDIKVLSFEEHEAVKDALYSALDLIKNEIGEGQVTQKLRHAILIIGETYNE